MKSSIKLLFLLVLAAQTLACPGPQAKPDPSLASSAAAACDASQSAILRDADKRAAPYGLQAHLTKNFADRKVSWLMPESKYQQFVVQAQARYFGRCNDSGCFVFAAPSALIHDAVSGSMKEGRHDPELLAKTLSLPVKNLEGPLRIMTVDLNTTPVCARLPVEQDPGAYPCKSAEDRDCFKFGGYTWGGAPELILINAPVDKAQIEGVQ